MDIKDSSDDSDAQKALEMEFRQILRVIKPYIPCVMNNEHMQLYRLWLEKLHESDPSVTRNRYLVELCYQIQDGILEYPFTQLPTPDPLPPFSSELQDSKTQIQKHFFARDLSPFNENIPETIQLAEPKPNYINPTPRQEENKVAEKPTEQKIQHAVTTKSSKALKSSIERVRSYTKPRKKRNLHTIAKGNQKLKPQDFSDVRFVQPNLNLNFQRDAASIKNEEPFFINIPQQIPPLYFEKPQTKTIMTSIRDVDKFSMQENIIRVGIEAENEDETSWYDLTEGSAVTLIDAKLPPSGARESPNSQLPTPRTPPASAIGNKFELYERKIVDLMDAVSELQQRNINLQENVAIAKYEQDITLRNNTRAETSIHNLACEVNSLKNRLQELTEIKMALKNSQMVVASQWETTVNNLNKELLQTQTNNTDLKAEVKSLQRKLDELTLQKQKDNASLKQKLEEMHSKEMETLKQNYTTNVTKIENNFNKKINDLIEQYESKINELSNEYRKSIRLKDSETQRLELMINTQCRQMHEEVSKIRTQMEENNTIGNDESLEKVNMLQKCVVKMDKLFRKSEKSFQKRITKLKREIEVRDKIIQIQLTSQRAELISAINTDGQIEVDAMVVQLEERYKKLLETQQTHFIAEQKNCAKVIEELRASIAKNDVKRS